MPIANDQRGGQRSRCFHWNRSRDYSSQWRSEDDPFLPWWEVWCFWRSVKVTVVRHVGLESCRTALKNIVTVQIIWNIGAVWKTRQRRMLIILTIATIHYQTADLELWHSSCILYRCMIRSQFLPEKNFKTLSKFTTFDVQYSTNLFVEYCNYEVQPHLNSTFHL